MAEKSIKNNYSVIRIFSVLWENHRLNMYEKEDTCQLTHLHIQVGVFTVYLQKIRTTIIITPNLQWEQVYWFCHACHFVIFFHSMVLLYCITELKTGHRISVVRGYSENFDVYWITWGCAQKELPKWQTVQTLIKCLEFHIWIWHVFLGRSVILLQVNVLTCADPDQASVQVAIW